jgi:metal-responsive CopG/Arc/MetJ family transcriptional regulator
MSQRAFYSIDEDVLEEFNRLVPAAKRSKLVQNLMVKYVSQNDSAIERAARQIEGDASYRDVMADSASIGAATLKRSDRNE